MAHLTYIGHATVMLELNGVRLLTDPLLFGRHVHLRRLGANINADDYTNLDAILISHIHRDHLDLRSLRVISGYTPLIVPHGAGSWLRKKGFKIVTEVKAGDCLTFGDVTVTATYARHNGSRGPFSPDADTLGYIIRGQYNIYFAGDTDLFPEMTELSTDLDVGLLPVWGWGPTLGGGHMDPYRAAQALNLLRPKLAIPIHWGTFYPIGFKWLRPDVLTSPPHTFARYASDMAPEVHTEVLPPGTVLSLPDCLDTLP